MLPVALRTLATRTHATVATSSRALLRQRAPRISPIQRISSAAFSSRGANPLAPQEGEEDGIDEHDEQPHDDAPLQQTEEQPMPKARGDHLPVNWSFYQSILGQPVVNTFHALQAVGYDAPWELYVRYCDVSGGKFRAVLGAMDAKAEDNFRARMKAGFKGSEAMYLNDCWKILMQQRKAEQGVELGEDDKPSVEGFTGGSWRSWNILRLKGRDDDKLQVKDSRKRTFLIPGNDRSISTLLPPTPGEENRWFIIQRPPSARGPSQSAEQNQNDDVQNTEDADADPENTEDAPASQRVHRAQFHRSVRLPSLPGTSIGSARFAFYNVDWSDESVDTKEVALMFDKDAQELQLIKRKPGAAEGEWEFAGGALTLEKLAGLHYVDALMELAKDQGLLDTERWNKLAMLAKLRLGADTLDLATNLARGLSLNTYPIIQRASPETRFRLYLDPSSSSATTTNISKSKSKAAGKDKYILQHFNATIFPTHVPKLFAARLGTQSRRNLKLEGILGRNDPNDPPELAFSEGGAVEILPYISTFGATPVGNGWEIDVSTPNRDTNPPIVTPPFPDAAQSLPPTSESSSSPPPSPGEALTSLSASPETLRIWGYAINQDISFLPRVPSVWKGGYYSAWTGEQVRERLPVLWSWAKNRGYWKEIPEKE